MNKHTKMSLSIGIIILFIVSSVSPMTNGYHNIKESASDKIDFLDRYNKYCVSELLPDECYPGGLPDSNETTSSFVESEHEEPPDAVSSDDGPLDSAWPMFCHDVRHTGRSPYSPVEYPIEKWCYDIKYGGYGSPSIDANGTIYFGGSDFYVINSNGTLKWTEFLYGAVHSNPAIDENGVIYFGVAYNAINSQDFFAFYPNGKVKWIYLLGSNVFSSPAIGDDGTIYFGNGAGNPPNGYINALYPNGTLKWRFQANHVVYSSPAIGDDGTIYCGSHDQNLYALYPNNGTEKWHYHTDHWIRTSPCIADDGTIYVVSLDSYLHAVSPNGTMKWKTNVGAGTSPTIGQDGTIYCGYANLYAVNPDGSVKWAFNPGSGRKIRGGTPCTDANGTIYFGTSIDDIRGGEIIVVNPDGTERWRKLISNNYVETGPCISDDGTLYVVSDGYIDGSVCYLHAFGSQESNAPPNIPTIVGSVEGNVREYIEFSISTNDPDFNPVSYYIEWGDLTNDGWTEEYPSGKVITKGHTYLIRWTYTIKVKARDTFGAESDWGYLEVRMPVNQQNQHHLFLRFLDRFPHAFPIMRDILVR